jgi:putative transposase
MRLNPIQLCVTLVRTVELRLAVDQDDQQQLDETFDQFQTARNHVARTGWNENPDEICTSQTELHEQTYDELRDRTDLTANHVQHARREAANALSSCQERLYDGRSASRPTFSKSIVVYGPRTVTYNDDYCTLSTTNGRIRADYVVPENPDGTPYGKYFHDDEWEPKEATLHRRAGAHYLHVSLEAPNDVVESTEHGAVLGVDLNVSGSLAVTSTGSFFGRADELEHERRQFERVMGGLQQTGTQSAHRTMTHRARRFQSWKTDRVHTIAKRIVEEAVQHECGVIALEALDDIRDDMPNHPKFQQWVFRRLRDYVEYKAAERGITVETVDPEYTSQTCSDTRCHHTSEDNRTDDRFECEECGREYHADYNAAKNIATRYVRDGSTSRSERATRQIALKSGRLDVRSSQTSPRL